MHSHSGQLWQASKDDVGKTSDGVVVEISACHDMSELSMAKVLRSLLSNFIDAHSQSGQLIQASEGAVGNAGDVVAHERSARHIRHATGVVTYTHSQRCTLTEWSASTG